MNESDLEAIQRRLVALERQQRRWKATACVVALTLAALFLLGAKRPHKPLVHEEVRARSFLLVDTAGTIRGRLGELPHGALGLGFYDDGKKGRLLLGVTPDGETSVNLFGRNGRGSAVLSVTDKGATHMRLLDAQWRVRASIATWPDGSPYLQMTDGNGKDRVLFACAELSVQPNGDLLREPGSTLVLYDELGTVRWRAP